MRTYQAGWAGCSPQVHLQPLVSPCPQRGVREGLGAGPEEERNHGERTLSSKPSRARPPRESFPETGMPSGREDWCLTPSWMQAVQK